MADIVRARRCVSSIITPVTVYVVVIIANRPLDSRAHVVENEAVSQDSIRYIVRPKPRRMGIRPHSDVVKSRVSSVLVHGKAPAVTPYDRVGERIERVGIRAFYRYPHAIVVYNHETIEAIVVRARKGCSLAIVVAGKVQRPLVPPLEAGAESRMTMFSKRLLWVL